MSVTETNVPNVSPEMRKQIWKDAGKASGHGDHSFMVLNVQGDNVSTSVLLVNAEDDAETTIKGIIRRSGFNNKSYPMNNEFEGRSKCNVEAGDTYDHETGFKMATERCLGKYHKQLNTRLLQFLASVRNLCAYTEHYLDKQGIKYDNVMSVEDMKHTCYEQHK